VSEVRIVSLPGDGIGPEVTDAMQHVLGAVASKFGHEISVEEYAVGYTAFEATGTPLPNETLEACLRGPAVFLGAVGDPRADKLTGDKRPEAALLTLRSELGCFANLRPARVDEPLVAMSALKDEIASGCDLVIVRELTGGLYYPRSRAGRQGSVRAGGPTAGACHLGRQGERPGGLTALALCRLRPGQ
jgi:3-isopropylmalate dehydrogenase